MYKKSFVSISFSSKKLKLVKLSADRHVSKVSSYDIPEGIIDSGKVLKQSELGRLVKIIWKKERIREKTVGLVLPEFSTFMKSLVVAHLPYSELDEAVRWKVREFLPHEGKEMILDWKIIGEDRETYEVLVVAIASTDLSGFVGAVDSAGLLPIYVETTSLCLERLAEAKGLGKVVLYKSRGTAVATVIAGKKILATSVLGDMADLAILGNLLQILTRFGKNTISAISVCGNGLTQEFVNEVHAKFTLPVELLNVKVIGLTLGDIQNYIIPLSQQLIDPEEPANAYSINLLPPSWVLHYKNQVRDLQLWTVTLVGSVVMWLCFLVALTSYVFISQKAMMLEKPDLGTNSQALAQATAEITKINTKSTKIDSIIKSFVTPQIVVNQISGKVVDGVAISEYEVNVETSKVTISGLAKTRDSLLAFKQAVEGVSGFSKVVLPLSNLLLEQDILFSMQMDYKPIPK